MALDWEVEDKVRDFINTKWTTKKCHLCAANDWAIRGYVLLPIGDKLHLVIGQEVLPSVVVVCKNCGNTHVINAVIAGAVSE